MKGLPLIEQDLTLKEQDPHLKVKAHVQFTRMKAIPSEAKRKELIRAAKAAFSVGTTGTK